MKPSRESGDGRLQLLLVDETESMRLILAQLLQRSGYEVGSAADATGALALSRIVRWDGVLIDVDLPDMSGVELYARILLEQARSRLPAIFMSSRPAEALELGLHGAHWARLVRKPCGFPELLRAIEGCLRANGESEIQPADGKS